MNKFLLGLAFGYLTMTPNGQELTKRMTDGLKKDVEGYLKKEGVIEEPTETTRPTEPIQPDNRAEEQHGSDETINE